MAPKKSCPTTPSQFPIGNCEVSVQAKNFWYKSDDPNTIEISISKATKIKVSVKEEEINKESQRKGEQDKEKTLQDDYMFVLVNPKDDDDDSCVKSYIQEVLKMYMEELPAMNYAANTGKKSMFLERCVSNGKFCTLLLKPKSAGNGGDFSDVIAAVTYQIIPADTRFVEIPLAAVRSSQQYKGFGRFLYMELRKRLQDVGISKIFCWGDQNSEGFWLKQGFSSIAEVDNKGKARRLPIKAAIRKALSFPGGSTLMVSYLNKGFSESSNFKGSCSLPASFNEMERNNVEMDEEGTKTDAHTYVKLSSCSTEHSKRKVWETSLSSLQSKKVKGTHQVDFQSNSNWEMGLVSDEANPWLNDCTTGISNNISLVDCVPGAKYSGKADATPVALSSNCEELKPKGECFRIMLMNIADDAKRIYLSKVVENLGGTVTVDGNVCTHVVTGKVRKTLNFCTALCSGAWIVSPSWLKESFRNGRFVDELPYTLQDEDYVLKYGIGLKDAVLRAKTCPQALLKGYSVLISAHVQPPVMTLSAIVRSAGGNIINELDEATEASKTIFIACDEDMEFALKKGVWTFSSDWLMSCVMKQELDLDAPQFIQSL
ncbi:hypothetical protein ACFE04_012794 [Oxalis oulophora]